MISGQSSPEEQRSSIIIEEPNERKFAFESMAPWKIIFGKMFTPRAVNI
jgi:hypothetical protein